MTSREGISSAWLGEGREEHRLVGAYWRARVLLKDRRDVNPAVHLLTELQRHLGPQGDELSAERPSIVRLRIERLYGEALIRAGNPAGRTWLLDLTNRLRDVAGTAAGQREQIVDLLSDLAADLTMLGEHDDAVVIAQDLAEGANDSATRAFRLSNASAWMLQRAVAHRVAGDDAAAHNDLQIARRVIEEALCHYASIPEEARTQGRALALREARAIELSISVESALLDYMSLTPTIDAFRELLRETAAAATSWEETYLQRAYRIGRFGQAYIINASADSNTSIDFERGRAYVQLAWDWIGNAMIRPWLPIALYDALSKVQDHRAARALASVAAERLEVQCGPAYPATMFFLNII